MRNEEFKFILRYIENLDNDIKDYNDLNINEDNIYDDIRKTIAVLSSEFPGNINDILMWKTGSGVSDANICIGLLKKKLIQNGYEEEKLDNQYNGLKKMYVFLKTYIKDIMKNSPSKLNGKYLEYIQIGFEEEIIGINLDINKEIKLNYGLDVDYNDLQVNIENIRMLVELFYNILNDKNNRYEYTKDVNKAFSKFSLPYKLTYGIVENSQVISSYDVSPNLNKEKFDNKIKRSTKLILSNDLVDKKCALKLLIDALEYLIDTQNKKGNKRINLSKIVNSNENSKVYAVLNSEIDDIEKMANSYFDLRHNQKTNEALTDPRFIEYLYNRIHSLLNLFIITINNSK